ncbi:glutaminase, partial [Streptococcus pneumoniae]
MKEFIIERQQKKDPTSQLHNWVEHYRPFAANGQSANYIPALGKINDSQLGICILEPDGTMIHAGDWNVPFTLQSISKVISFI